MYNFHKLDYSKNKSMYMYSKYYGKKFIKNFFLSRRLELENSTINYSSKLIKKSKKNLFLLLSFETKRKIYIKDKEISINDYIELSYLCGLKIKRKIDFIYLNSLLKLNDYILFLIKKNNQNLSNKIKVIFLIEEEIIKNVSKNLKIDEKN